MISFLRGNLHYKKAPILIVDINGIGYECQASMSTFYHLPEIDHEVFLYTHFIVREDAQVLYAFYQEEERALFRSLIKINNVGPKLALAILSSIAPDHFVKCILDQDINALVHIPGVGKKTAERLIIEMRDRLNDWNFQAHDILLDNKQQSNKISQDAISALVALGFKPQEASRLISLVEVEFHSAEELIRLALQNSIKGSNNDFSRSSDKCSIAK